MPLKYLAFLIIFALGCGPAIDDSAIDDAANDEVATADDGLDEETDSLAFDAKNFVEEVNNPYFSIIPGRKYIYEGLNEDRETVYKEVVGTSKTKDILGVTARAIWERTWINDVLERDDARWYAQDKAGNVWILGEERKEIFGGLLRNTDHSWMAGEGGAKAGVVIPAEPEVGESLQREHNGFEEESSEIIDAKAELEVAGGTYADCLEIEDKSTAIENESNIVDGKEAEGYKPLRNIFCADIGHLARKKVEGTTASITLKRMEDGASEAGFDRSYAELELVVSENEAKSIALDMVADSDKVKSVELALYNDRPAYWVKVIKDDKSIANVYVDITSGNILAK